MDQSLGVPIGVGTPRRFTIRLEMEDISELPTDLAVSVVPHEDSWKVVIMTDGPQDADRCDMIETIAERLRSQFDLKT